MRWLAGAENHLNSSSLPKGFRALSRGLGQPVPTAWETRQAVLNPGIARELTGQRRHRVFVCERHSCLLNEGGELL